MLSILAIVVAGVSLVIVTTTVYRNLPNEPEIVRKSDHGPSAVPSLPTIKEEDLAICDHELNLVL